MKSKNLKTRTLEAEKRCLALENQLRASKAKTSKAQLQAEEAQAYIYLLTALLGGRATISVDELKNAKGKKTLCQIDGRQINLIVK